MNPSRDKPLAGLRVLLIEDMASLRMVYRSILIAAGAEVRVAATAAEGRMLFRDRPVPVVLMDLTLRDGDGLELMNELRSRRADLRIVVITAHGGVGRAVEAMRAGAHDFLVKPFGEERLIAATRSAAQSLAAPGRRPRAIAEGLGAMVGSSRAMAGVALRIAAAAPTMAPVLVCGEPGTGKELTARMLHALSGRADAPFLAIDCRNTPIPEIERALFSDSGALYSARETTLYLADLPFLPLDIQQRLLPLFHRAGSPDTTGHRSLPGQVRLVAGSSEEPGLALARGRLDPALLHMLDTLRIDLPPLRQRGQDAVEIARAALAHYAAGTGKPFDGLSLPVETLLAHHPWPGNVRELLNLIRQIVLVHPGGRVTLDMLPEALVPAPLRALDRAPAPPEPMAGPAPAPTLTPQEAIAALRGLTLAQIERAVIEAAILAEGGSLPRAAKALGVAPSTLYRKREAWEPDPSG